MFFITNNYIFQINIKFNETNNGNLHFLQSYLMVGLVEDSWIFIATSTFHL